MSILSFELLITDQLLMLLVLELIKICTCTSPRPLLLPLSYYLQCFPCCQSINQYLSFSATHKFSNNEKAYSKAATVNITQHIHKLDGCFDWLPNPTPQDWFQQLLLSCSTNLSRYQCLTVWPQFTHCYCNSLTEPM